MEKPDEKTPEDAEKDKKHVSKKKISEGTKKHKRNFYKKKLWPDGFRMASDDPARRLRRIDKLELQRALQQVGVEATLEEVSDMMEVFDSDGDGTVDFGEFWKALVTTQARSLRPLRRKLNPLLIRSGFSFLSNGRRLLGCCLQTAEEDEEDAFEDAEEATEEPQEEKDETSAEVVADAEAANHADAATEEDQEGEPAEAPPN
eukprot:s2393_g2.t1